ncbi:MAG: CPBP family intramembrane glutamic endopeptidase [Pseudomonadota bacterium]
MLYPVHEGFIAPARARPQIWRVVLGIVLATLIYAIVALAVLAIAVYLRLPSDFMNDLNTWSTDGRIGPNPLETELRGLLEGRTPTDVLVMLSTFGGMFLGAMAAARWLHGRSFVSLTGPLAVATRHFGIAALATLLLSTLGLLIPPYLDAEVNLRLSVWLTFLPMALVMVLLQTGAEELLFRGYLQQQLAARFRSPLVWMLLPSILFGLGHYNPAQFGDAAWLVVAVTTLVGIFAADLTARTGTIGAAWGLHFANNVVAILIISLEGPLSGLSLWWIPEVSIADRSLELALVRDIAVLCAIWLVIRRILRP